MLLDKHSEIKRTMGHCISSGCMRRKVKKITLLMVGLDNAGKTSTAKCLLKESREGVAPTVGFSSLKPRLTKEEVTIYDLGGGKRIRGIWKNYFAESFGLIFVIDAADREKFSECKTTLNELMRNEYIAGKPALILANKQDSKNALDEIDICDILGLETIVNESKCRTKIETCSATAFEGKKIDKAILKGYLWLVQTIVADYESLHSRVERDTTTQKIVQEKDRREREERVRKIREEREKNLENYGKEEELNDEEEFLSNPFRPISSIQKDLKKDEIESSKHEKNELDFVFSPPARQWSSSGANSEPQFPKVNGFVSETHQTVDKIDAIFEEQNKPKKKKRFGRNNKTAPLEIENESASLPPIQFGPNDQSRRGKTVLEPITRSSDIKHSWESSEELESAETNHPITR